MSYQFSPMSFSSPPQYLDNMSPPRQETINHSRTPSDGGSKPKRRRLEQDLDIELGMRAGQISSTDTNTWSFVPPFEPQAQYVGTVPGQEFMDLNPPSSIWGWDEAEAFDYLTSEQGFRRDLYGMPSHTNQSMPNSTSPLPPPNNNTFPTRDYHYHHLSGYAEISVPPIPPMGNAAVDQGKMFELGVQNVREQQRTSLARFPSVSANARPLPVGPRFDEVHQVQVGSQDGNRTNRPRPHCRNPPQTPAIHRSSMHKPSIILTLSRATESSIAEIPEHKRECPACQLEFEPDNYLASISCCSTPMHATCLSAWVNSQTYAKAKVCMKCRKPVDARRPLNTVVPPVTDKSWDEGVDFNAPESLKEDNKIELDVGGRPERAIGFSRARRSPHYSYNRRRRLVHDDDVPPAMRPAIQRMRNDDQKVLDSIRADCQHGYHEWSLAYEAEVHAAQAVTEAREALKLGQIRPCELDVLIDRCRDARLVQERKHEAFKAKTREQDRINRDQQYRMNMIMDQMLNNAMTRPFGTGVSGTAPPEQRQE